jgi:hypothetical protein
LVFADGSTTGRMHLLPQQLLLQVSTPPLRALAACPHPPAAHLLVIGEPLHVHRGVEQPRELRGGWFGGGVGAQVRNTQSAESAVSAAAAMGPPPSIPHAAPPDPHLLHHHVFDDGEARLARAVKQPPVVLHRQHLAVLGTEEAGLGGARQRAPRDEGLGLGGGGGVGNGRLGDGEDAGLQHESASLQRSRSSSCVMHRPRPASPRTWRPPPGP